MKQAAFIPFKEMAEELTLTEKRIVQYFIDNSSEIIRLSITDLAARCSVSVATIVRLCKKLGYSGYQEFRISFAQSKAQETDNVNRLMEDITPNDSAEVIIKKVFTTTIQSLQDTQQILKMSDMEKAVKMIQSASSISFFGLGGAGVIANDAYHRFTKLGIPCNVFLDAHSQLSRALLMSSSDIIVAISHSGKSRDILLALRAAKEKNVPIISVTQLANSPITKLSDISLFTSSSETVFRHDAMASRIAETVILDSLFTCVAMTRLDEVLQYYNDSWKLLKHMRVDSIKDL